MDKAEGIKEPGKLNLDRIHLIHMIFFYTETGFIVYKSILSIILKKTLITKNNPGLKV